MVFLVLIGSGVARAADFEAVGSVVFPDKESSEISLNLLQVYGYKIGDGNVWTGEITRDGEQIIFSIPITDILKNDQVVLLVEGQNLGVRVFGGATTVITERELKSGTVGPLVIQMSNLPVPALETTDDAIIKICWAGITDFSVVGYEIFRSEIQEESSFQSVGRSGQTAGKQACFVDNQVDLKVTYYYRIAPITSWNASDGREVRVSQSKSDLSDGIRLKTGVYEKIIRPEDQLVVEADKTMSAFVPAVTEIEFNRSTINRYVGRVVEEIEKRGFSIKAAVIYFIAAILIGVILVFILSIALSNWRSGGSGVWNKSKK